MNAIVFFDPKVSKVSGTIKIHQCNEYSPSSFKLNLKGLKPNTEHAIHVHKLGNISGGCMSAGGHYNPFNKTHGSYKYNMPRHSGDLINNIKADKNGKINLTFKDNLANLIGFPNILGRTIVIHEKKDDLGLGGLDYKIKGRNIEDVRITNRKIHKESLKTGNAGGRMSCAIIGIDKITHF